MKRTSQTDLKISTLDEPNFQLAHSPDQKLAQRLAVPMFGLSLLFLVLLAGLTVVWVDMAMLDTHLPDAGLGEEATNRRSDQRPVPADAFTHVCQSANTAGHILFAMLLSIWPCFFLEPIFCRWSGHRHGTPNRAYLLTDLWPAICPPLRLAKPNVAMGGKIWLPINKWHLPGKPLAKRLEKVFSKPMLMIALLILPVLLIEFGFNKQVQSMPILKLTLSIGTGLIWCAFAIEFIVMVSVTDKKWAYVKKNWVDLAIILLPLVSFLRSLRVVRAANIAKFAKVQQLSRMSRIYRMRGLVAKSIRALMVLEVMHRILKQSPEKRIVKLKTRLADLEEEANEIRSQINRLNTQQLPSPQKSPQNAMDSPAQCERQGASRRFVASRSS